MAAADPAEDLIAEGNRAEDAGDLVRACELYRRAVSLAPRLAKAHLNLGVGLEASGDPAGALASYEKALAIDPASPAANYNLGKLLYTRGAYREAEERLRQALESRTQFPEARIVRGYVLLALGELEPAANELETGLAQRPHDEAARAVLSQALFNLAEMRAAGGDLPRSLEIYRRLLARLPGHAAALCNVGTIMKSLSRVAEALDYYRKAIAADPQSFEGHYNLAITQREQGHTEEALAAFRRAIELRPSMADAHFALGNALRVLDRKAEALAAFERALALDPDHVKARWSRAIAQLPAVYAPGEDPQAFRRQFAVDLAELEAWFDERRTPTGVAGVGADQPFELAYQEENNRPLLERYGALCTRLMGYWQQHEQVPAPIARRHRPLRVGFVSAHLRYHSVWSAITKGWFQGLDPERFTLSAFHVGTDEDQETAFAKSRAAHFERGPKDLRQWVDAIRTQEPDVLIYPEIGMDPMTLRLASLRLAPVQAASWGHPETSGLPSIDYYLSAEDLEPEGAQVHYTERLVALPHLGCHFEPFNMTPVPADPGRAGIDPRQALLVCPGVPVKYAPQHDWVFPEIAHRLGRCRFIFFAHWNRILSDRLVRRLQAAFTARGLSYERFVTIIPWQTPAGFLGWLRCADVFLDTIGFSGFNTALQAVESGLPIVTRDGRFLRGRLAGGILKRLGLHELVVPTEQAYVDLAVRLAEDSAHRQAVAARIAGSRAALYQDRAPVRALEDFLVRAAQGA
ncbi:MAG TPA: tetratricopeptide repeat protein [Burkholderiales bacterium]|nr:tetratricopeptide repeat protein [Burkholderiales bacterium]